MIGSTALRAGSASGTPETRNPRPRSLYLHVPFCANSCPYCDFTSVTDHTRVDEYVEAVCTEIHTYAPRAGTLETLFLGGGTPSLLAPVQITRILGTVQDAFHMAPDCECTIEVNPGSALSARAEAWCAAGVNRVSIGAQSLDPAVLKTLGRRHGPAEVRRAVETVRAAGCANVNVDVMYGVPGQHLASLHATLDGVLALEPEHVSAYQLTIEPATPFGVAAAAGRLPLPDDGCALEQQAAIEVRLAAAGLERYEISNYARPGYACRHNLVYWEYQPFLGCGTAAVGFDGHVRTRNTGTVGGYIDAVRARGSGVETEEVADRETAMFEAVLSGLRLRRGVDAARFAARFGETLDTRYGGTLAALRSGGFLEEGAGRWRLTARGLPVANEVVLRFMP